MQSAQLGFPSARKIIVGPRAASLHTGAMKSVRRFFRALALLSCLSVPLTAQSTSANSGTIRGSIVDPSGAAVKGASVEIRNPVSGYNQKTQTDSQGKFELFNVPFNPYHVSVKASGFETTEADADVKASVPLELAPITLRLGTSKETVDVVEAGDLIETDPVTHTDIDRAIFDKLPLESASSSLSSLVTLASPGVSADSNGLFHGLGDHASNSFSVDGQSITDKQSKVFSNPLPSDAVQSMEVIEGAPPAEYGDKTSLVIVVTTRSGLGSTQPHGDFTTSFGSFDTYNEAANLSVGGRSWGNFISINGMDTSRFLDGPEPTTMHDHGNQGNLFDRLDFKPSTADTINFNFGYTRSWFQTPRLLRRPKRDRMVQTSLRELPFPTPLPATALARVESRWVRRISALRSGPITSPRRTRI